MQRCQLCLSPGTKRCLNGMSRGRRAGRKVTTWTRTSSSELQFTTASTCSGGRLNQQDGQQWAMMEPTCSTSWRSIGRELLGRIAFVETPVRNLQVNKTCCRDVAGRTDGRGNHVFVSVVLVTVCSVVAVAPPPVRSSLKTVVSVILSGLSAGTLSSIRPRKIFACEIHATQARRNPR